MNCSAPTKRPLWVISRHLTASEGTLPPTEVGGLIDGAAHFSARTTLFATAILALLVSCLMPLGSSPAHAQTTPTVTDRGVRNEFPQRVIFSVSAESGSPIKEVRLHYKILPDGTAASGLPDF